MDHSLAKAAFEEIQARPYGLSDKPGEVSNNCYFKGIELLQRLGIMGYTVRGRIGEMRWPSELLPAHIMALLPKDVLSTHFFVEIYQDGKWRILDPSFQPALEKCGLPICTWGNGVCCCDITKLYTQEESLAYQANWFDPDYQKNFFKKAGPFWKALNTWFQKQNQALSAV